MEFKQMAYFDDAKALVEHAANELPKLQAAYDGSLSERSVKPTLLIEIKNLMENLRSAMDFAAHGLFDKYGTSTRASPTIYFPYSRLGQTQAEFQASKRIEMCIPGITAARPDVVAKLESFQHFIAPQNEWLPKFMDLNNENKHSRLTPQTREESRQLTLQSGGTSISMGPGCSISMGPGTSIRMGGMSIPGGQSISANSPARFFGSGTQTVTIWVSFKFESNGELVVPFLKNAVVRTKQIVDELGAL
jgi:hypothetical protein